MVKKEYFVVLDYYQFPLVDKSAGHETDFPVTVDEKIFEEYEKLISRLSYLQAHYFQGE